MKRPAYISIIILFISILPAFSQNDSIDLAGLIGESRSGLFESDELLELTLRFDITSFTRTRQKNEYQEAVMIYYLNDKDTVTRMVRLRARGEFRRNFCDFPPIRLNLKKNELPGDKFHEIDKIKLVTHCKAGNSDYILREYLVYKIYNVLSDFSFRVRLLKINYINTRKPGRPLIEYAFLIEPVELLTERTNTNEVTSLNLTQKYIKPEHMDRVAIFNYMIGNYDWAVPGLHNLTVLSQPQSEQPHLGIAVPYDFDYCGLVNTDYAYPPETLPITSVRQRMYRGFCRSEEAFGNSLGGFLEKKQDIYKVIDEFPYLRDRSKKDMKGYLESFYRDLHPRNILVYTLLRECVSF